MAFFTCWHPEEISILRNNANDSISGLILAEKPSSGSKKLESSGEFKYYQ